MICSSTSSDRSDASDRNIAVSNSISELEKCGYHYCGRIGRGSFGDVIKLHQSSSKDFKAAKIIIPKNIEEKELLIWSRMKHENIVEAEGAKVLSDGTIIVFMPLLECSLFDAINEKWFVKNRHSLPCLKSWFRDSLNAVHYLHLLEVCHLDLTLNNVLISRNGYAKICDFSFATNCRSKLRRNEVGAPSIYKPPELSARSHEVFDGKAIDIWCFGLMIEEALSGFALTDRVKECYSWRRDIKPVLKLILYPCVFQSLLRHYYSNCQFNVEEFNFAMDFIDSCLRMKPEDRITTHDALKHPFMQNIDTMKADFLQLLGMADLKDNVTDQTNNEITPNSETHNVPKSQPQYAEDLRKQLEIKDMTSIKIYKQEVCHRFQKAKEIKQSMTPLAKQLNHQQIQAPLKKKLRCELEVFIKSKEQTPDEKNLLQETLTKDCFKPEDHTTAAVNDGDECPQINLVTYDTISMSSLHSSGCELQSWIHRKWSNFMLRFSSRHKNS